MSKYYYLISGLPSLSFDGERLGYRLADFKSDFYPFLSDDDKMIVDLFFLQYDNANVLKLLKSADSAIERVGNYSPEVLSEYISSLKEGDVISSDKFPSYLSAFILDYLSSSVEDDVYHENQLTASYYTYAMMCKNHFVSLWFELNLNMNNILLALTARKYQQDVASLIVGNTDVCMALRTSKARDFGLSDDVDAMDRLIRISEMENLLERERAIDLFRWDWLEEHTFFNVFSIERLFAFLQQVAITERWFLLNKEEGKKMLNGVIAKLRSEIEIPVES